MHQIIIALGLRPPGTLLMRLRSISQNVDTEFKHAFRHPRVYKSKLKMKQGKN